MYAKCHKCNRSENRKTSTLCRVCAQPVCGVHAIWVKPTKEVAYTRLVDGGSQTLWKLESDSRLDIKDILQPPDGDAPKSSSSDSKLSVDYFSPISPITTEAPLKEQPKIPTRTENRQPQPSVNTETAEQRRSLLAASRAASITSENPSEIFLSADEDTVSIDKKPDDATSNGIYPSDVNISYNRSPSRKGLPCHRSDHEIHTPEHRTMNHIIGDKLERKSESVAHEIHLKKVKEIDSLDDSDSSSSLTSVASYLTAISSQDDLAMVNLHMQVNNPITESPLLMAGYMFHMSQMQCYNWDSPPPVLDYDAIGLAPFVHTKEGTLVYAGSKFIPIFEPIVEGFTTLVMVDRNGEINPQMTSQPLSAHSPSHPYFWESPPFSLTELNKGKSGDNVGGIDEETLLGDPKADCVSIMVKLKGDVNIMLSPLMLESLQRFVEAISPTLTRLHPLTVVNHFHMACSSQVEASNVLKREKSFYLTQLQASKRNTASKADVLADARSPQTNIYEECVLSRVEGSVHLPKVNVTFLQVSLVEEIISFAALDNIHDLTCVSLLAVCLDNVEFSFCSGQQVKRALQSIHRPPFVPKQRKKLKSKTIQPETLLAEIVLVETSELLHEETVLSANVCRMHGQLRRLRNDSSLLKDAYITAIPHHASKVLFKFAKVPCSFSIKEHVPQQFFEECREGRLGFIMFECGFEGVTLKAVKREGTGVDPSEESSIEIDPLKPMETEKSFSGLNERCQTDSSSKDALDIPTKEFKGGTSVGAIELKAAWFNFAAPPQTPITRKIDFTRLDWNLLSTVSTAVNAWINPSHRFTIKVVEMLRCMIQRSTGVMSCLMAEALDVQRIHLPTKSKYGRLTPFSKAIQEDPSCQLCGVLQRYVLETEMSVIENNLLEAELPPISTLRQGVIVLSRQWKNVLFTPILLEHNFRMRKTKPYANVTFSLPEVEEEGEADLLKEQYETTDEETNLLDAEMSSPNINIPNNHPTSKPILIGSNKSDMSSDQPISVEDGTEMYLSSDGPLIKTKGLPSHPLGSTRASVEFPIRNSAFKRMDMMNHFQTSDSNFSIASGMPTLSTSSQDQTRSPSLNEMPRKWNFTDYGVDLYNWMAKQQSFMRQEPGVRFTEESKMATLTTEHSQEESWLNATSPTHLLSPSSSSLQVLDAHIIFKPLLTSLGLMPHQIRGSSLGNWSSNASITATVGVLRIDIIESESKTARRKSKASRGPIKFYLDIPPDSPSFSCEKIGIEVDLKKVADLSAGDMIQSRNVIYISRNQLKKHTNSVLNFSVSVHYICQQVNMPLLRLLHQIASMYQNVQGIKTELRQQHTLARMESKLPHTIPTDIKQRDDSSCSDIQVTPRASDTHSVTDGDQARIISRYSLFHSPSIKSAANSASSRPQSFTQRLRGSNNKKGGYQNLSDRLHSPEGCSQIPERSSGTTDKSTGSKDNLTGVPRCWRTIYYLLDLYATTPETKTITNNRPSIIPEAPENYKGNSRKYYHLPEDKTSDDVEKGVSQESNSGQQNSLNKITVSTERIKKESSYQPRLMVFGVARIQRTRLLATLSGLKLESEITSLQSSTCYKRKNRPVNTEEFSLTGHVGRIMIVLLEGVAPNLQTVVKVTVGKSQSLYSSISKNTKDKNSGLLTIGAVNIDIPQHPVVLHGMMTRSTKQLSTTLQELRVTRTASRISRGTTVDEIDFAAQNPPFRESHHAHKTHAETALPQPLVMQFSIVLQSLIITAALLPSLQAQYTMDRVTSMGVTGCKAKFTVDLMKHTLSFTTKLQTADLKLPPAASIELPQVHVFAEYIQEGSGHLESQFDDGVVLRHGGYLNAVAEIGTLEHCLTTDLLNHLVFVQKVFMKEVNEVVQKMSGGDKPVPLWMDDNEMIEKPRNILFALVIRLKGIQITATTPTNSAVRLETGLLEFQLSNRVQNVSRVPEANKQVKLFVKAQVDINLSLGQLNRNAVFEEAEPEYQEFAFFKTRIGLRNAFQDEVPSDSTNEAKEVVIISLNRPLIYIQPQAVDKAIMVWLNYKNAYEYWNEQRTNLNKEVLAATQQVFEKVPFGQLSSQTLGTLFLQLTVDDMGICLPLKPLSRAWGIVGRDCENTNAVVVTLESTSIAACSSGSLVSKAKFVGLCLRFSEDFEVSLDDWKPDMTDPNIMNLCVVSEGTYEVCSHTIAPHQVAENAKWLLNVKWQMDGVDIHLDVNVGKYLSALGHTLTMLTGDEEEEGLEFDEGDAVGNIEQDGDDDTLVSAVDECVLLRRRPTMDTLPPFFFDNAMDPKRRSKMIEKEMSEQAKLISDLRTQRASPMKIEQEVSRLKELETLMYKDFRRDMMKRLRRQSVKASSIKDNFGLGSSRTPGHLRSKSFVVTSPSTEYGPEAERLSRGTLESSPDTVSLRKLSTVESIGSLGDADSVSSLTTNGDGDVERNSDDPSVDTDDTSPTISNLPFSSTSVGGPPQKPQEPNIDFELDVIVSINSGKCVLHTKDVKEEDAKLSKLKKDKSMCGGISDLPSSPVGSRRRLDTLRPTNSTTRLGYQHHKTPMTQLSDLTIFHIPGLDVKVHYESKTLQSDLGHISPRFPESGTVHRGGIKKASLFAWMTLQSIPEETIISPHILEFLEQTLEPIPVTVPPMKNNSDVTNSVFAVDLDTSGASIAATQPMSSYAYASFPVDVVVYFHMQPSTFRFSCLPTSRVECLLQLPSLHIVFSSKRAEGELSSEFGELNAKTKVTFETSQQAAIGGLSVTGCLADFSVYIFHPYGGSKKTVTKEHWSPLSNLERKDALSINVEFVKFHLSRSRKLNFVPSSEARPSRTTLHDQSKAIIRFSTIVDIGSASFKYDMRRLTEILAFPKAWYRKSIVRRLFLGDLSTSGFIYSEDEMMSGSESDSTSPYQSKSFVPPSPNDSATSSPPFNEAKTFGLVAREKLRLNLEQRPPKIQSPSPSPPDVKPAANWETLVLFAVNFTKLNVHMNMGNVMGNVMWLTRDFCSEGRLSIGSSGHKNLYIGIGLGGSSLDAKGGIVGGTIEVSTIDTYVHVREDRGVEPDHVMGLKLFAIELRLDYTCTSTSVLMGRVSNLEVTLRDEWKIASQRRDSEASLPTRRPALVFMHGDLAWDQLQLLMSRSTTADLLKMYYKLEEFFSKQFRSSKWVISSLHAEPRIQRPSLRKRTAQASMHKHKAAELLGIPLPEAKHHRHWQRVLSRIAGFHLANMPVPLPETGTVLGGTMDFHGKNISLACFHGMNFKSKSWALFSLREPFISFSTEAQELPSLSSDPHDTHIVQNLLFSLGIMGQQPVDHMSMATVCRIVRKESFPPQFRTIQDWFHYAFFSSEIDSVDRFPTIERERSNSLTNDRRASPRLQEHNHSREIIFALPSLQLHLKTEHLQAGKTPDHTAGAPKADVECSLITEFQDHIYVTVDADTFFFLHDLINSYVKESEKLGMPGSSMGSSERKSPEPSGVKDDKKKIENPVEMLHKDWRNYECKTWHLEPTIRLLSWAGQRIDPYGIDYILQHLGFSHARTTIPKWMQRGFMDPLDKILAVLVLRLVEMAKEANSNKDKENAE